MPAELLLQKLLVPQVPAGVANAALHFVHRHQMPDDPRGRWEKLPGPRANHLGGKVHPRGAPIQDRAVGARDRTNRRDQDPVGVVDQLDPPRPFLSGSTVQQPSQDVSFPSFPIPSEDQGCLNMHF